MRWIRLGAMAWICTVLALAVARAGEPPATRRIGFTVFSATPMAAISYRPEPTSAWRRVVFYPTARSPRYAYEGGDSLRFFDETEEARLVAEVALPPGASELLLLFAEIAPRPAVGPIYRVYVLDDASTQRAGGTVAIVNFSGLELRGTVAGREVTVAEGLNPAQTAGRSAEVELSARFRGRDYRSYAETLAWAPGERALLILLPPFAAGSVEVQSRVLLDRPPTGRGAPPKEGAGETP